MQRVWLLAYPVPSRAHNLGAHWAATFRTGPEHRDQRRMSRRCIDCPAIIREGSRCPTCARAKDAARGTRAERGYGAEHVALRAEYQRRMDAGERFLCWRCGGAITPGDNWHLDHTDDRTAYGGPSHARCNLAAAGRESMRRRA